MTIQEPRFLVVYNQNSGREKIRDYAPFIKNFLERRGFFVYFLFLTPESPNLPDLAALIQSLNINRLIVAGGDGSLRRVAEQIFIHNLKIPIGFFPIGSANIYAMILKLPLTKKAILKRLISAKTHYEPVGIINQKHLFLMAAYFGQLADISLQTDRQLKKKFGWWAYLITALRQGFLSPSYEISSSHHSQKTRVSSSISFLNKHIYKFLPKYLRAKQGLETIVLKNRTQIDLFRSIYQLYGQKTKLNNWEFWNHSEWKMQGNFPNKICLDGDEIMLESPYHLQVKNNSILFIS